MDTFGFKIRFLKTGWLNAVTRTARRVIAAIPLPRYTAAVGALVFGQVVLADAQSNWVFDVQLDGKTVGDHSFTVVNDGAGQTITSEANFDVKLLFVTVFRYRHTNVETWHDSCLRTIDASTSSNGKSQRVIGRADGSGLVISSDRGEVFYEACIKTFAYWNPAILKAEALLNSQTGDYVEVEVTRMGDDMIVIEGVEIPAQQYALRSKPDAVGKPVDIVLWYSADQHQWLGLESKVNGGRVLRYQATRIPRQPLQHSASADFPGSPASAIR